MIDRFDLKAHGARLFLSIGIDTPWGYQGSVISFFGSSLKSERCGSIFAADELAGVGVVVLPKGSLSRMNLIKIMTWEALSARRKARLCPP